MRNFIIYLSDFRTSQDYAERAVRSAAKYGWAVELFPGINGNLLGNHGLDDYNIKICEEDRKTREMMERPGVRGCFLSHYQLWKMCAKGNEPIGIFEHDIEFIREAEEFAKFDDILRLEGFELKKSRPAGHWYEGARAYILKPRGARKILSWIETNGALPADVILGDKVLDITCDTHSFVRQQNENKTKWEKHKDSFTWNLSEQQ